jgi:DNA-binding XRE family transcriptional regulator
VEPRAADAYDAMRFLRELRQLRNEAGLEPAELAARAHYPRDVIVAAEAGPSIPALPVLSAYVRGCGAGLTEWEERWRSLTGSPTAALCLPARPPGTSSLADAGARLGAAISDGAAVPIPPQVMRFLSASAGTASAGTTTAERPLPGVEAALPATADYASKVLAIRPVRLPAARNATLPRAVLAAAVAAVIVALGAILVFLRRRN